MTKRVTREMVLNRIKETDEYLEMSTSEQGCFMVGAETALRESIKLFHELNGTKSPVPEKQLH